jgi:PLP dependent protein
VCVLPGLRLRGLMAIGAPVEGFAAQREAHRGLRELLMALCGLGLALDTLSMGMSADLEAAIAEGATIVRIGTAIFGARP